MGLLQNAQQFKGRGMNILLLGGTDGSHMLANLLLKDSGVNKVYHIGAYFRILESDRYVPLKINTHNEVSSQKNTILNFLDTLDIDLIIPVTLSYLLWNDLQIKIKNKNIPCLGPSKEIAMLEWSKILGKELLTQLEIPTPDYKIYNLETLITDFLNITRPFVFKYDSDDRFGLQTVIVNDANCQEEYERLKTSGNSRVDSWKGIRDSKFDPAFIVEKFIASKQEYSYHAICNKVNWQYIGSARDYKKRFEGDTGFNTSGIGAYAGIEINPVVHTYVDKIFKHLKENGKEWIGVMYLGIIEDQHGTPQVLEINTRFGNPELQVILPLINTNLKDLFYNVARNKQIDSILFSELSAVALRIIHKDYPNTPTDTRPVDPVFSEPTEIYINYPANRTLFNASIVALGDSITDASNKIYSYLENKEMHDFTYRKDIGYLE